MARKRKKFCEYCGKKRTYSDRYDSFYCADCNVWLEPECGCLESECEFTNRPSKPNLSRLTNGKEVLEVTSENIELAKSHGYDLIEL